MGLLTDAQGTAFAPWESDGLVGFKVTEKNGAISYIYLNPSSESDDGVSNVFLYQGSDGDPGTDAPIVYINI